MRRHCWTIVLAGLFSLGVFGCALSSEMEPEDDGELAGSAVPENIAESDAESEVDEICPRWLCESVHPSGCEGFGYGASVGRCRTEARNNCTAHCGAGCSLDDTPTCESI